MTLFHWYLIIIILAMLMVTYRFIVGSTVADRVVALDTLTVIATAGLVILAYVFQRYIYVDVSLIYAVLSF
ncbi:MAG: hypothetical protein KAI79_06845, partial [Bacteroidales bacterium]|nr:hypothetical protein [Bacteroidales bacterium]